MSRSAILVVALVCLALGGLGLWALAEPALSSLPTEAEELAAAVLNRADMNASDASGGAARTAMTAVPMQRKDLSAQPDQIAGRVLDAEGNPVSDARIDARPTPPWPAQSFQPPTVATRSNDQGEFHLDTMAGATYTLIAEAHACQPQALKSVSSGSVVEVHLLPGAVLNGCVVDAADQQPVEGALVQISRGPELPMAQVTTDHNGRVRCDELVPGTFPCSVLPLQHADRSAESILIEPVGSTEKRWEVERGKTVRGVVRGGPDSAAVVGALVHCGRRRTHTDERGTYLLQGFGATALTLEVTAEGWMSGATDVDLRGSRNSATRDFFLQRSGIIDGVVLDPAGQPVSGARVAPVQCWNGQREYVYNLDDEGTRTVTTGADGMFSVSGYGFHDGRDYGVRVEAAGWPAAISELVTLTETAPRAQTTVRLARGVAQLKGLVVHEDGAPIADALVLTSATPRAGAAEEKPICITCRTDAQGEFFCAVPLDCSVTMEAQRDGFVRARSSVEVFNGLPQGKPPRLVLRRGTPVSGIVLDATEHPIAEARVNIRGSGFNETCMSASDGSFKVTVTGNAPWSVNASAPRFTSFYSKLAPDENGKLRIVMAPASLLRFEVRGSAAQDPLPANCQVRCYEAPQVQKEARATELGRERVAKAATPQEMAVNPGRIRIVLSAEGCITHERIVECAPGVVTDAGILDLERGVGIDGMVRLPDGTPVPNARILARAIKQGIAEEGYGDLGRSAADGWFARAGLRSGDYDIAVESEVAPLLVLNSFRLDATSGTNIDFTLQPRTTLKLSTLRTLAQQSEQNNAKSLHYSGEWINSSELNEVSYGNSRMGSFWNSSTPSYSITALDHSVIGFDQGPYDAVRGRVWYPSERLSVRGRGKELRATVQRLPEGTFAIAVLEKDKTHNRRDVELTGRDPVDTQFDLRTEPGK